MKAAVFARAQGLRCAGKVPQRMCMGTLATFKTPKVANEINVSLFRCGQTWRIGAVFSMAVRIS